MNIEIFFFLVYRQLFTFALLKTTRPPRSLFLTVVILNLYLIFNFEKSLIKYYYIKNIYIIIIIIIIIIIDNDTGYIKTTNNVASKWIIMISSNER